MPFAASRQRPVGWDEEDVGGRRSFQAGLHGPAGAPASTSTTAVIATGTGGRLKSFAAFLHQPHRSSASHPLSASRLTPTFPPRASISSDSANSDYADEEDETPLHDQRRRRKSATSTRTWNTVESSELERSPSSTSASGSRLSLVSTRSSTATKGSGSGGSARSTEIAAGGRPLARRKGAKDSSQSTLTDLVRYDSRDSLANSRRLTFPPVPSKLASPKGKRRSKDYGGEGGDDDEEEERYSRRGSDWEGSERGRRSSAGFEAGAASDSLSEEGTASEDESDSGSEAEEEVAPPASPSAPARPARPQNPVGSRSRSSSAPSTPRPPRSVPLVPLTPTAPQGRVLASPPRPPSSSLGSATQRRPVADRHLQTRTAPPARVTAPSATAVAGPSTSQAAVVPAPTSGLPSFASLIPSTSARLVEIRTREPIYWPANRDFALGPYPYPRTIDSSSRSSHDQHHGIMPTRSQTLPIPSSGGVSTRPSGTSGSSAQAYGGTAGGFGPSPTSGAFTSGTGAASGQGVGTSGAASGSGSTTVAAPIGTPLTAGHSGIEILLDSPDLVLRTIAGQESSGEPAILSGEVHLTLTEPTSIKDITLVLRGVAKIDAQDHNGRRQHVEHPLFFHDESFLHAPDPAHPHAHTLQGCVHRFPFSISLPSTLPASLRTYTGSGIILYKLKAVATRGGGGFGSLLVGGGKWEAKRLLRVARSFETEAVEWSQTLEIDNTWPGKISYIITLPHKAFAAGDAIPVSLKFTPLMKGVRVVALVTAIKETVILQGKSGHTHQENRDVLTTRHEFFRPSSSGSGAQSSSGGSGIRRNLSHSDMNVLASRLQAVQTESTPRFPAGLLRHSPTSSRPFTPRYESTEALANGDASYFGQSASGETINSTLLHEIAADVSMSEDIETIVDIQIPSWTTPTHTTTPIQVSHKIKWSAFIKNPDGHTSELRCALPIHILAPHLAAEARLASSGVRNLLFGPSGALAPSEFQQADLPSYSDHVRDRVAPLDTASIYPTPTGLVQAPWTLLESALHTPIHSPPPSRPPSPSRMASAGSMPYVNPASSMPSHRPGAHTPHGRSGTQTPAYGMATHDGAHVSWADAELLRSLEDDSVDPRPALARADSSQSSSRSHSAPNSRPPSRPASPTLGASSAPAVPAPDPQPQPQHHGGGSFFSLHLPKPLRALTPMSRSPISPTPPISPNSATAPHHASLHARLAGIASASGQHSSSLPSTFGGPLGSRSANVSTTDLAHLMPGGFASDGGGSGGSSNDPSAASSPQHAAVPDRDLDAISRVPSYNVASRGALGGGPVPLSSFIGLPSYEESSTAHSITSTSPTSVSIPSSASPTSHGAHSPTFPQTRS